MIIKQYVRFSTKSLNYGPIKHYQEDNALVEKNINEIPKEVVIDECIRLAKKFSNEKAYKYVNAKADILYDL